MQSRGESGNNMVSVWLLSVLPALLLAGPALKESRPVVTQEMVDHINSQGGWKASKAWAGDMTLGEARRLVSQKRSEESFPEEHFGALFEHLTVPATFDARIGWPDCVGHTIRDQGNCAAGWAIAATDVVSDRHCIYNGLTNRVSLSPEFVLSCNNYGNNCYSENDAYTWKFMYASGNVLDSCFPYTAGNTGAVTACSNSCIVVDYVYSIYSYTSPAAIQTAILDKGPVQTSMDVYEDFFSYDGGVYYYQYGDYVGIQGVKIIGWGYEDGESYWIAANSWGTDWGEFGFFNIYFGECSIDSAAIAANIN